MNNSYYTIQFDKDGVLVSCETTREVYALLKNKKLISISRYNDSRTGANYEKNAVMQNLSIAERARNPLFIKTILSIEGIFVPNEDFWIENYMLDEFYNPDKMPYIEKIIKNDDM